MAKFFKSAVINCLLTLSFSFAKAETADTCQQAIAVIEEYGIYYATLRAESEVAFVTKAKNAAELQVNAENRAVQFRNAINYAKSVCSK